MKKNPIRVLIAKPGLDGHDRGAKVVALALKQAGMEVIYTGLRQTVDQITNTALQEDVQVVGLSILSGAHLPITKKLLQKMKKEGLEEMMVLVGGNVPKADIAKMKKLGVKEVFPTGSRFEDIVSFIQSNVPN
ncbi:MAG: cobalamin B12-binding domain-containing protein [Methanomassiliicoccales archaeon]|nr:MAG: cobalamin B12-binding domain-containing protein [Methanomassiliicoccales archaeon]